MKIESTQITKLTLSDLDNLDPVSVIAEDIANGRGKISFECYGKAFSAYWGGMGDNTIAEFFCSCDEHYIASNVSGMDSEVYDIDAIRKAAEEKGIECHRDDPWNDYEFMDAMYGGDMSDWHYNLPRMPNHEYEYLCRIIKAVQVGLTEQAACKAA
ncbi:MAG: hypothetical protein AB1Y26_07660 [Cycloclasticus sp.]